MHKFHQRFLTALNASGLSQSELGRRSGISKSRISKYAQGTYVPKQDAVYLLAQALGVSPSWLWGMGDDPSLDSSFVSINLNFYELQMLRNYRQLSAFDRDVVDSLILHLGRRNANETESK